MKARRNTYLVIGLVLIVMNLFIEIETFIENSGYFRFDIGSLFGYNFF